MSATVQNSFSLQDQTEVLWTTLQPVIDEYSIL
jgi:hypothetical protein